MPELTEVVFMSQALAEACVPRSSEAIVSITNRGAPTASLNEGWAAVLRIAFDDVDPVKSPVEPGEGLVELQESEAESVAEFVTGNRDRVTTLIVHCRYGQARSAGVAKAVAKAYGLHFPKHYRYANNFVYQRVLKAMRRLGRA